jgi:anti-sigma-K factor RskA
MENEMRPDQQGDMRVADYVLGLMSPVETARFEQDLRTDPLLADQVGAWRERVSRLKADAEPTPQAEMRRRIADGLSHRFGEPRQLVAAQEKPRFSIGRVDAAILGTLFGAMIGATLVWLALG